MQWTHQGSCSSGWFCCFLALLCIIAEGIALGEEAPSKEKNDKELHGVPIRNRWASINEVIAAVPATKLVEHEVSFAGDTFIVTAPKDAIVRPVGQDGYGHFMIVLAPDQSMTFLPGKLSRDSVFITRAMGLARQLIFADEDLLLIENNREKDKRFVAYLHLSAGYRDMWGVTKGPRDPFTDNSLPTTLLLLKCARSLRPKEPFSNDPIATLKRLDAQIVPDTTDPREVATVEFTSNSDNLTTGSHLALLENFPNLKDVKVEYGDFLVRDFGYLVRCKSLESCELPTNSLGVDHAEKVLHCTKLKVLDISVENVAAAAELGALANLESLSLSLGSKKGETATLQPLANLKKLREVELQLMDFTDFRYAPPDLGFLTRLPSLKELKFIDLVTDDRMKLIGDLESVESLKLNPLQATDVGIAQIGNLKNLEQLWIESSTYQKRATLTRAGFEALGGLTRLSELYTKDVLLDDSAIEAIAECPAMSDLTISGAPISDAALDKFKTMKKLEVLRLYRCKQLTREKVESLKNALLEVHISWIP